MRKPKATTFRNSRWWTTEEAREALTAMRASGLSLAEFAEREGLRPARLRAWEQRVGGIESLPRFVEVAPPAIQLARQPIEIVLPSGVVLRVAETVDPDALGRIVEALTPDGQC